MESIWKGANVLVNRGSLLFKLAVIFTLILSQFPIYASASATAFKDVNEKHWAKDVIEEWDDKGFISGYTDGNFYPNQEVSRAEFLAFISRSIKDKIPKSKGVLKQFYDVQPSDWFYEDVMWAVERQIVSGYADGSFRPAQSITREEAAAILFNIKKYETDNNNVQQVFQDYESISEWSREAVNQIVGKKVMNGFPDGTFKPLKPITRAESVSTLNKMLSLLSENEEDATGSGISGKVLFDEVAVSGATVKVYEKDGYEVVKQTITNAQGSFSFDLGNGDYDVTVEKGNFIGFKSDISVKNNKVSQDIPLEKGVKITGKIKFDSKQQAKDATVIFTFNPTFTTGVDEEGNFVLYVVANEKYSIRLAVKSQTKLMDFDVQVGDSDMVLKEYMFTTKPTSSDSSSDDDDDNDSSAGNEDIIPPLVAIQSPTTESKYGTFLSKVSLSGTSYDNEELTSVEYVHYATEGTAEQVTTPDTITVAALDASDDVLTVVSAGIANGKDQWSVEDLDLFLGKNIVKVTAKDASGNQASDELEIYYDPDMLSIMIKTPTEEDFYVIDQSKISIYGAANSKHPLARVDYTVSAEDETIYASGAADGTVNWSISDVTLQPGISTVNVAVTDEIQTTTSDSIIILNTVDSDHDFLADYQEPEYQTDCSNPDTDGDGLYDGIEVIYGLNPLDSIDGHGDLDNDGLSNTDEQNRNTALTDPDTDSDGLLDGEELAKGSNPLESDTDQDKLNDGDEINYGTDPNNPDTDGDGILDGEELFPVTNIIDGTGVEQKVIPSVLIKGELASTTMIENIEGIYASLSRDIPGYLGAPYEFSTEADFDEAIMTFTYDPSLDTGDDFEPAIYYFNEETGLLELLENQNVDRSSGTVTVTVPHFSIYILLNKKKWEEAWNQEILRPRPGDEETKVEYVDIVFAIDSSGSMSSNDRNGLRKAAVINFINTLLEKDRGAIVDFDSSASVKVHLTTDHQQLIVAVNAINASGGTNLNNGLNAAINELLNNGQNSTKYIIFLTDGQGTYNKNILQPAINNKIAIYTVGLGSGVNEPYLQEIAELTGGKYYFASTADDLVDKFEEISDETTGPKYEDLDNDGISDYEEVNGIRLIDGKVIFTDPTNPDTDGDGINDGEELGSYVSSSNDTEIEYALMLASSNGSKQAGYNYNSQPDLVDTDGDGYNDKEDDYPKVFHYKLGSQEWADQVEVKKKNYEKNPNYQAEKIILWDIMKETNTFKKELVGIKTKFVESLYKDSEFRTYYTKFNKFVGEMDSIGITKDLHYFRNVLGEDIAPKTLGDLININKDLLYNNKWDMLPYDMAAFHMNGPDGIFNTKFVLGTDQYFEAVYNKDGSLATEKTDPVNMGTYNFFGPDNADKHKAFDVDPYFQWDNTKRLSKDFLYADGVVYYGGQALKNMKNHKASYEAKAYYQKINLLS